MPEPLDPGTVTFNRDVAPILFEHCAACHRPGGSSPFELLTFADARKRAGKIAMVSATRSMPPWLPEPGPHPFANERAMTTDEITTLQRWLHDGARGRRTRMSPLRLLPAENFGYPAGMDGPTCQEYS